MESMDGSSRNCNCRSLVAVARSTSGGVAIRYVLPVLWMTSRLAVTGASPTAPRSDYHERRCDTGAESEVYECLVLRLQTNIRTFKQYVAGEGVPQLVRRNGEIIRRFSCMSNESEILAARVDETLLRLLSIIAVSLENAAARMAKLKRYM